MYTLTITTETATRTEVETFTRLAEGDVQALRDAARFTARPGDTVTFTTTQS